MDVRDTLDQEARALLTRLDQLQPLALSETMVLAAALPVPAHRAIEEFLHRGRRSLRTTVDQFRQWLRGPGAAAPPAELQQRFVLIRLRFNDVLSQLDLFTEVFTQRSEHRTGVWLSGLDALAADALAVAAPGYQAPQAVCYLARGPGAAIRRARTRLPGGDLNPVAIIRIPRERMVGHGIASSLVHEVGHQVAALLDLNRSLRLSLAGTAGASLGPLAAAAWSAWISEVVADVWSVGLLGIGATMGLLAVVSLPRPFVHRASLGDPHPVPYLRVLVSATVGEALYPHPQWAELRHLWRDLYPTAGLAPGHRAQLRDLERSIPRLVELLLGHRPAGVGGLALADLFPRSQRQPHQLLELNRRWRSDVAVLARQPPTLVFAAIGQARVAGRISPEGENQLLSTVLRAWAIRSTIGQPVTAGPVAP